MISLKRLLTVAALVSSMVVPVGSMPLPPAVSTSGSTRPAFADENWEWPVDGPRGVTTPFRAPAHAYGAGHRGIDLAVSPGAVVRAPADGTVAFRGTVVDRPLLTIEHAGGYVLTFEPLDSSLKPGDEVTRGDPLGVPAIGGHTPAGSLHFGVRLDGEYVNPLLLFGAVERAILLPCCSMSE